MIKLYSYVKLKNPERKGIPKEMIGYIVDICYAEGFGYGYFVEFEDLDEERKLDLLCQTFSEEELIVVKEAK